MVTPASSPFGGAYAGRTVLVTGHTGFKGAWLTLWLRRLGANVVGYALAPDAPSLFTDARAGEEIAHVVGDVRDRAALLATFERHRPDVVLHLAAQALVNPAYRTPAETFETNVLGTVNLLEAVRACPSVKACVVVTSDKCYDNREWIYAYRENDAMGGNDPYSASKGCAELVSAAYRRSFFPPERFEVHGVALATARAGNVIGGGDWAEDRIVPDCIRALRAGRPITVRNPGAIRPWQHVLEPLAGYLWLGAKLLAAPAAAADSWNFGPPAESHVPVRRVVEGVLAHWGEGSWQRPPGDAPPPRPEAGSLRLDTTKARCFLEWAPVYDFAETLAATVDWYRRQHMEAAFDAQAHTWGQIEAYELRARAAGLAWAQ